MSKKRSKRVVKRAKATPAPRAAVAVATSAKNPVRERVAAMAHITQAVCDDDQKLQSVLKVLRDTDEPTPVRLAALQALQAASFSAPQFESCRGDYLATLRSVMADTDAELRQRVLGILAREKDGFAQQRLLEGLEDPEKALVPPEKALQLLSYDVHAEAYPAARKIVSQPPSVAAKREALKLLAADAASRPVFEHILRDKEEDPEARRISASALQAVAPQALQTYAREIVLDPTEPDELQETSLTAITQFGDQDKVAQDATLMKRVSSMKSRKGSAKLKQVAGRFLTKYGG
jgi:hypothetical protein